MPSPAAWMNPFDRASLPGIMPWPMGAPLKARNAFLDRVFYNVGGLTPAEEAMLTGTTTREGRILIVHPAGERGANGVMPFDDHAAVRDSPGALLDQFCVAGVGSSDLGAAALARDIANATRKPVGAIVAGYGLLDLAAEGLGGWAYLGTMNRILAMMDTVVRADTDPEETTDASAPAETAAWSPVRPGAMLDAWITRDCATLRRFFADEDREIRLLVGHSKGCLSLADTMTRLDRAGDPAIRDKLARVRIVTTGAVVRFPAVCADVTQYLGEMDVLGACNSRGGLPRVMVPQANHHLNTQLPYHMSLTGVLRHAETGRALWTPRTH